MEVPQFFYPMPLDVRPVIQTARPLCPRSDFEWGGPYHPSDNGLSPALFASDDYGITPPVSSSSGVVPLDPYRLESPHGPPPAYQVEEQYLSQRTQADVVPRNVPADVYPVTIDTNSAGLGVHESYSFANTSHPLFFPSQQLPPTLSPQQPLRPPSWEPFPASPLPLRDTATHTPPPFPAHWPTPKSMIPCAVDPISPTEILAYITLLGGEGCTCTWGRSSGGTCWFRSSVDGVKRHVRRVHFGAKGFICKSCGRKFYSSYVHKSHLNSPIGRKSFECGQCELRFTSPSSRSHRKRRVHTHRRLSRSSDRP